MNIWVSIASKKIEETRKWESSWSLIFSFRFFLNVKLIEAKEDEVAKGRMDEPEVGLDSGHKELSSSRDLHYLLPRSTFKSKRTTTRYYSYCTMRTNSLFLLCLCFVFLFVSLLSLFLRYLCFFCFLASFFFFVSSFSKVFFLFHIFSPFKCYFWLKFLVFLCF
jgi:hypothetical protein